ncbi:MAG: nitroreductase family protein [Spirochaetaceae bacterium]|nr:nitroreductase family protein [Spirochaetaceae bacterium]
MKNIFISLLAIGLLLSCSNKGAGVAEKTKSNDAINNILSSYSLRNFSDKAVSDNDIETIIKCGVQASSARNLQPWYFTVIKDNTLAKKIIPDTKNGNVIIAVSGVSDGTQFGTVELDCGFAIQNMYLGAQALGLGSRIYTGPVANVNTNHLAELGIPSKYKVVALIKIGHAETIDSSSAASSRKNSSEMVNYK